ncbi:hypothetical protein ACKI14_02615 [Streptomyces turgidiscabies]|uniref:hypothetical protein n=1 Tax=Streptomyces turgidiscabies TaxID=85558 RepID=UPI0038F7C908
MTHRPYPNPTRARRQLDHHDDETPPLDDGPSRIANFAMPRIVISDEARAAMGVRLAEAVASMRGATSKEQTP